MLKYEQNDYQTTYVRKFIHLTGQTNIYLNINCMRIELVGDIYFTATMSVFTVVHTNVQYIPIHVYIFKDIYISSTSFGGVQV